MKTHPIKGSEPPNLNLLSQSNQLTFATPMAWAERPDGSFPTPFDREKTEFLPLVEGEANKWGK